MIAGTVAELLNDLGLTKSHVAHRQAALDAAHAAHPGRFTARPRPARIPTETWIKGPSSRSQLLLFVHMRSGSWRSVTPTSLGLPTPSCGRRRTHG